MAFNEDSSASGHDEPWIQWFCGLKGHEMFCEVERSYIEDGFNLYGLRACVSNFSDCLDLILDRIGPDDSDDSHLTQSACTLYGLIHARYIITAHGLDAMYNKYAAKDFGTCPLVQCKLQNVLPVGLKDEMGADSVKLYCPKCQEVYHAPPVRSRSSGSHSSNNNNNAGGGNNNNNNSNNANSNVGNNNNNNLSGGGVDGAAFGTTFPHLFLMTFSNLVPDPLPVATSYVPRVFGFRVHKATQRQQQQQIQQQQRQQQHNRAALVATAAAAAAAPTPSTIIVSNQNAPNSSKGTGPTSAKIAPGGSTMNDTNTNIAEGNENDYAAAAANATNSRLALLGSASKDDRTTKRTASTLSQDQEDEEEEDHQQQHDDGNNANELMKNETFQELEGDGQGAGADGEDRNGNNNHNKRPPPALPQQRVRSGGSGSLKRPASAIAVAGSSSQNSNGNSKHHRSNSNNSNLNEDDDNTNTNKEANTGNNNTTSFLSSPQQQQQAETMMDNPTSNKRRRTRN